MDKIDDIWLLFFPGAFGTTVEYMLREFTDHPKNVFLKDKDVLFKHDGSMHSLHKESHHDVINLRDSIACAPKHQSIIHTPICHQLDMKEIEIIDLISAQSGSKIFLGNSNILATYFIKLNVYKKIFHGLRRTEEALFPSNEYIRENVKNWGRETYNELETWQKREFLSIFFSDQLNTDIEVFNMWKFLKFDAIYLYRNLEKVFNEIADYVGVLITDHEKLKEFVVLWQDANKPVYDLLDIFDNLLTENYTWDHIIKKSGIDAFMLEVLIQHKLMTLGYEIKCYNLNVLPTDSNKLKEYTFKK